MTTGKTPRIDDRSAQDIYAHLANRLEKSFGRDWDTEDPVATAVLRIFARYCELIIDRLNQVPDKNYLAFLNLIGVSRVPPVPAHVPLTFVPVKQLPEEVTAVQVPERTKVAAPADGGESEPAVFETTRSVQLTNVELRKLVGFDPREDRYAEHSALTSKEGSPGEDAFAGGIPVAHEFYIGHRGIFGVAGISQLRLRFNLESRSPPQMANRLEWLIPTPTGPVILIPVEDATRHLTQSGEVVFESLPKWPPHKIFCRENCWLSCRLATPLGPMVKQVAADVSSSLLPKVRAVTISAVWKNEVPIDKPAFLNSLPLDTSKDFFPLGERPRFGDVFYIKSEAFTRRGASIALRIKLTNPASAAEKAPIRPTHRQGNPQIQWESWTAGGWTRLDCRDETQGLTEDGTVSFCVPPSATTTVVNGQEGSWIRARLISGDYGQEERFELISHEQPTQGLRRLPATLAPPAIHSLAVTWSQQVGFQSPEALVTHNNLAFEEIDVSRADAFLPFRAADHAYRSIYCGAEAPVAKVLAGRTLDLYFDLAEPRGRLFSRGDRDEPRRTWRWQYWNGRGWKDCVITDDTACLATSGIVSVQIGGDISHWRESSIRSALYWLRVFWQADEFADPPLLQRIALNTVPAVHTITLANELLGSSNGTPSQTFHAARAPMVGRAQLEVREPEMPTKEELARLYREEGHDAVTCVRNSKGRIEEIWVRWHEVDDFLSSDMHSRHYVVNRLSGEIQFGDGSRGLVPPTAANNIRLQMYQTGGGISGNQPAGKITQVRTAVPFVDSVVNLSPALGGQDIEDWGSVRERGSRCLRHRGRAVTAEDYEDLALEASPDVARAKCYPLRDLANDPSAKDLWPGVVSVVVVPRRTDPSPKPRLELLRRVREFLDDRRAFDADLVVLAPEYVRITVEAEIVPITSAAVSDLVVESEKRLREYLHPLTGGPDGRGWPFGELPQQSDLYALLASVPKLRYVQSMRISVEEERPSLVESRIFLACSGTHRVLVASQADSIR